MGWLSDGIDAISNAVIPESGGGGGGGGSSMPAPPTNSPWSLPQNQQGLQANSSFLPDNYMVSGPQNPHQAYDQGGNTPAPAGSGAYPAMQNSYGLGATPPTPSPSGSMGGGTPMATDNTPTPGNSSSPNFAVNALSQAVSDSGSRGFNPWSMQGEANARSA